MKLTLTSELETTAVLGSSFEVHASKLRAKHEQNEVMRNRPDGSPTANFEGLMNVLNILVNQFHDVDGLIARLSEVNQSITNGLLGSTRRFELETLQAGQVCAPQRLPLRPSTSVLLGSWRAGEALYH